MSGLGKSVQCVFNLKIVSSISADILKKARMIRMLLTDCDGVLTDGSVYYSNSGESMKRFHIRDGMGVERLRHVAGIETGIISGEESISLKRRAEKLLIKECHLGVKEKGVIVRSISERRGIPLSSIAYIGDDINDLSVFSLIGLSASPRDAMSEVKNRADFVCELKGGEGVFREFAELIMNANLDGELVNGEEA